MNPLFLILLLSLGQVGGVPMETIPPGAEAAKEANDRTIAHLSETLALLNEALIDMVARTRHPESSNSIKKIRERIARTETAIEARRATLRSQRRSPPPLRFGPLPPAMLVEPPYTLL